MIAAEKQILFACTQNAVRSVIAKGLFETKPHSISRKAVSCGVVEGCLDGFVVSVMQEKDIDVSTHQAQIFEALNPADFDLIISFSNEADQKARLWANQGCKTLFWAVSPPMTDECSREGSLESYREIRDEIDRLLTDYFGR